VISRLFALLPLKSPKTPSGSDFTCDGQSDRLQGAIIDEDTQLTSESSGPQRLDRALQRDRFSRSDFKRRFALRTEATVQSSAVGKSDNTDCVASLVPDHVSDSDRFTQFRHRKLPVRVFND
jgi:hypothetical protein